MSNFEISKDLETAIEKSFLKDSYKQYKKFKENVDKLPEIVKNCEVYLKQQKISVGLLDAGVYFDISFDDNTKSFLHNLFGDYVTAYIFKTDNFINIRFNNIKKYGNSCLLSTIFLNKILTEIRKNFTIQDIRFDDVNVFLNSKKTIYDCATFNEDFKVSKDGRTCCIESTEYKVKQEPCNEFKNLLFNEHKNIYTPIVIDYNRHYHMATSNKIFTNTKDFIYKCFIKFINLTEFGYLVASRTNINSQILIIKTLMRGEVNFKLYDDKVILWSKKYSLTNRGVNGLFNNSDFGRNDSTNILFTNQNES